ncbi:tetraacyldisaccharide 4'-kinase [Pseudofulvibacter geojedonensis]|uniref:Tetraacyldisaccharide 4'-kinase n=1 Tax=Pseudofulvibacter geojedonensis TaxID=1123758 RepID=A0ABW3I5W7_9FLAO
MRGLRKILFPFAILYGLITSIRNYFFDIGLLSSKKYKLPIIVVGNLNVGGTGKSPMVEYLIRLLQDEYKLATLSRGYRRKSKGFVLAEDGVTSNELGDEPMQFYSKYKKCSVAVDADRQNGINKLQDIVNPEVIVLDDAYQHRKVKAGFYVLLTKYNDLYVDDYILPTGNLREARKGANRADVIIVTKCPTELSKLDQEEILKRIQPLKRQKVFFSSIKYDEKIFNNEKSFVLRDLKNTFTLVTGIANPRPLLGYLNSLKLKYEHIAFNDHHHFSERDIELLARKEFVITTEKDYMRLKDRLKNVMYLPIQTQFMNNNEEFDEMIFDYIKKDLQKTGL